MLKTQMNPRVFWGASLIIALLLGLAALAPGLSDYVFQAAQDWVIAGFGWFYVAAVAGFLAVVIGLALAPTGRLRLGEDDSEPDYPYPSWLAMLFAAGMGIGLMYFAVAEPVQHYAAPPDVAPGTFAAAREAMVITFLHWGVHAWGIYALVGLTLAYFAHRKGLPLTLRSGLYPLLGRRIYGPVGDAVDIFAIWSTLFGIATSLGFGVSQINSGLAYLIGIPNTAWVQVGLIVVVMGAATISVLTGLDRGVRRLSELNLFIAVGLMLFVLAVGPTSFLLKAMVQNVGLYLDEFFVRTFNLYAYEPRGWMADWTLFYWAWWIAWSPFVGMFIARISRGRTVREFVIGVLLVPTGFTFIWMTVFGNTAISLDMAAAGELSRAVTADLSTALFHFFEALPGTAITSSLAILLVAVFFVTSADSGSLVIDTIASGGAEETPRWQRVYWCGLEGGAAAVLLLAGGLGALQAATLVAALPFVLIMIALCFGLVRQASADAAGVAIGHEVLPLRSRLMQVLAPPRRADIVRALAQEGAPALQAVCRALEGEGLPDPTIEVTPEEARLEVVGQDGGRFVYRLRAESRPLPAYSHLEAPDGRRSREWRLIARVQPQGGRRDVTGLRQDQLVNDVLEQLGEWRRSPRPQPTA
ncbi:MAG: transporter [Phenylobacterium sp. RIFCSPHIGHO2_01_FULL_70_10]|nr:MAG: transporter [Phenylobacterium sp. RIFCSPHIGHO2_01_FULL_70_10]